MIPEVHLDQYPIKPTNRRHPGLFLIVTISAVYVNLTSEVTTQTAAGLLSTTRRD
jgi:hypothetical protein